MFEQKIQDQEMPSGDTSQPQLFKDYEIKTWNISARIYKILAASLALNLAVVLTMGQTNLMTRKGCDSPLVGSVCDVLDTVYFGSKLFGTDTGYIDADYEKTDLAEADITYINVGGREEPLTYPAGYFQLANPGEFEAIPPDQEQPGFPTNIPGFTTTPSRGNLAAQPQVTPTPNKNPIEGELPDVNDNDPVTKTPPFVTGRPGKKGGGSTIGGMVKPTPNTTPTPAPGPSDQELAEASTKLNKKPGYDLAYGVLDQLSAPNRTLDLSRTFKIEMNGVLNEEGRLSPSESGIVAAEGDEEMKLLAKRAIETVNDMGMFIFVKKFDVDHINFKLEQDDKQIYAVLKSDKKDLDSARRTVNGMKKAIALAKMLNMADEDTVALLKAATITQQGKSFVISFTFPKEDAQMLIKRQLEKAAVRRAQEKAAQEKAASSVSPAPPGNSASGLK